MQTVGGSMTMGNRNRGGNEMIFQPPSIEEKIGKLRNDLFTNGNAQKHYRRQLNGARTEKRRLALTKRLEAAQRNGVKIAAKIAKLEQEKEQEMRAAIVEEVAADTASEKWPFRANVKLRFGDKTYARGSVIPNDVLTGSANADHLIRNGHVRRIPPPTAKPTPKPEQIRHGVSQAAIAGKMGSARAIPLTALHRARTRLREIAEARHIPRRSAIDMLIAENGDLVAQAGTELSLRRRKVRLGAWGSGGGTEVEVGQGSPNVRRVCHDLYDQLCRDSDDDGETV
jgi:hypothetical protein